MVNKNLPNYITMFRIILVPITAYFLFSVNFPNGYWIALVLFIIASLSDWLDGAIARKHNLISNFGKIMDPLADKLLVLTVILAFTMNPIAWFHPLILIIIALREISVTVLREIYLRRNIVIPADKLGKIKTITQMCGLVLALFYLAWKQGDFDLNVIRGIQYYFWGVALITLISGMNYFLVRRSR